jgi:tetratricopeptide (TPR) repeat protein
MPEAVSLFREAGGMFSTVGDVRGVADMLFALSVTDRLSGNLPSARRGAEEALRLHRELDDRFGITGSTFALGRALFELGEVDSARAQFLDGLEAAALMRDRTGMAIALDNLADLENAGGRPQRAMRLAGASESVKAAVGGEAPPAMVHLPDPREVARRSLSEAEIEASRADGRAMTVEEALAYAREPL